MCETWIVSGFNRFRELMSVKVKKLNIMSELVKKLDFYGGREGENWRKREEYGAMHRAGWKITWRA